MERNEQFLDLRRYRPAAVLVIDLVRHSRRDKPTITAVQAALEDVLSKSFKVLDISDFRMNYTGDGYLCALLGDSSARLLDFINASIPELRRRLSPFQQEFRVALDFGLVHLRLNALTKEFEHFDLPGINAARLEGAAKSGQVLCTEIIYRMFAHHYPRMFPTAPTVVRTKDTRVKAYEVVPVDFAGVQRLFADLFFGSEELKLETVGRKDFLVVDDERPVAEAICDLLESLFPGHKAIGTDSGEDALALFEAERFVAVVTDLAMPVMSGWDLTREIFRRDRNQAIVIVTGWADAIKIKTVYGEGAHALVPKPFQKGELGRAVVLACKLASVETTLELLSDDRAVLLTAIQTVREQLTWILTRMRDERDVACTLLRHKAKQIVRDVVGVIQPGNDVAGRLEIARTQLSCVERLARAVRETNVAEIQGYVESFIGDLRRLHAGIEVELQVSLDGPGEVRLPAGTVVTLIICELIDNAVSAIQRGGRICVSLMLLRSRRSVQIVVRDTGPGIHADVLGRVFEEGVSTKGTGRGLGLSLVQDAVRTLKGEISYEYDNGAVFTVILPCDGDRG